MKLSKEDRENIVNFNEYNSWRMMHVMNLNGIDPDIKSPKTFQEKLLWLNIYDIEPLKWRCADKLLLRDYSF